MIIIRPFIESFCGRASPVGADQRIRPHAANATGKQHVDHECLFRMAKCGRAFVPCSYSIGLIAGGYADPPLRRECRLGIHGLGSLRADTPIRMAATFAFK